MGFINRNFYIRIICLFLLAAALFNFDVDYSKAELQPGLIQAEISSAKIPVSNELQVSTSVATPVLSIIQTSGNSAGLFWNRIVSHFGNTIARFFKVQPGISTVQFLCSGDQSLRLNIALRVLLIWFFLPIKCSGAKAWSSRLIRQESAWSFISNLKKVSNGKRKRI